MKSIFRSLVAVLLAACALFLFEFHPVAFVGLAIIAYAVVKFDLIGLALRAFEKPRTWMASKLSLLTHYKTYFTIGHDRRERPMQTASWRLCSSV